MSHSIDMRLSLPLEARFRPTHGRYKIGRLIQEGSRCRPVFYSGVRNQDASYGTAAELPPREEDPWEARQELFHPDSDVDVFTWSFGRFAIGDADLSFDMPARSNNRQTALQADFQEWRNLLLAAMETPQENWKSLSSRFPARKVRLLLKPIPLQVEWRDGKPVGVVKLHTALEAVIASLQIDKLTGTEFRLCDRPGCQNYFRLESRHEHIYCSDDCGHYMAVKKSRERAARNKQSRG